MTQCCCCWCWEWVLHSTTPDNNTTVADASAAGQYAHTRFLTQTHSLLTPTAHTRSRALSLSVSSLFLSLSLARSLTLSLSLTTLVQFPSHTRLLTQTHTLALTPSRLSVPSLTCCLLRTISPSQTFLYVPFFTFYKRIRTRHNSSWQNGRTSI